MIGGKFDDNHGAPVRVVGTVKLLSDGEFVHRGPMSTGVKSSMGRTAVIRCGGVDIIVNERRFQPVDPEVARSVGIEPRHKKIVVLKSAVHYRASYEPIAEEIIEVDGPGLASLTWTVSRLSISGARSSLLTGILRGDSEQTITLC